MKKMKYKKNGFTIIEIVAVIALIAIIATLAVVSISAVMNKVKEREYLNLAKTIESAAEGYSDDTGVNKMFVQTLIDKGLVETDDELKIIYDPRDSSALNCQIVKVENSEATLEDEDNPQCDVKLLSDDAIKIMYTLSSDSTSTPKDLPTDYWFNESIILSLETTGLVDVDLTNAKYKWTSPLSPDKTYNSQTLKIDDIYVNDTFQVTITVGGRKYTAYGKVKIDREPPKVFNLIDTDPENWSPIKKLQFEISDAESGIQAYQVSLDGNAPTSDWITVNPKGKKNDKINVSQNLSAMQEGESVYIWVKDMVGNINKSDVNANGGDGALQINNIDGKFDTVTLTGNPDNNTYTQNVTLTGSAQDLKSGIVKWVCSNSKNPPADSSAQWKTVTKTNAPVNITCPTKATANGEYYLHAKDAVGNIGTAIYKVTNIDNNIDRVTITDTSNVYREQSTLIGTASDSKSGIVGYAFSTSASKPSSFNRVTKTNGIVTAEHQVNRNIKYYFHVIDAAGNWSYDYVTPTNIVISRTKTGTLYSRSMRTQSDYITLRNAVKINNVRVDNGYVNYSLNGTTAYITAYSGYESSALEPSTCKKSPTSYLGTPSQECRGGFYCDKGGDLNGTRCTGRDYPISSNPRTYMTFKCTNNSWNRVAGEWPNTPCKTGYDRKDGDTYNCNLPPVPCTTGETKSFYYGCSARCYWGGDYNAKCSGGTYTKYTCNYGDAQSGSTCYRCNEGTYRNGECHYSCQVRYYYYEYNYTIYYYELSL